MENNTAAVLANVESLSNAAIAAVAARDAIENCCSPEWFAAHKIAREACRAHHTARVLAQRAGLIEVKYWESLDLYDCAWANAQMANP